MKFAFTSAAVAAMVLGAANPAAAGCNRNQVYSSSMAQCIPKSLMCNSNQVYSSSMSQCIPKSLMCDPGQKYRNGKCI